MGDLRIENGSVFVLQTSDGANQVERGETDNGDLEVNSGSSRYRSTEVKQASLTASSAPRYAPLDGGWGWMCVVGGFVLIMFAAGMIIRSSGIMFVALVDEFETSATETAWINAVMLTLTFSLAPFSSWLTGKIGARRVICMAATFISIGFISSQFVTQLPQLYGTISVMVGIGGSFCHIPAVTHVGLYFEKRKSLAIGISAAGSGLGALMAGPLTTLLLDEYYLSGTFLILGGIYLNIFVCAALMRPLDFYNPRLPKSPLSASTRCSQLQAARGLANPVCVLEEDGGASKPNPANQPPESRTIPKTPETSQSSQTPQTSQTSPIFDWALLRTGEMWIIAVCFMFAYLGHFNMMTILIPVHADAIGLEDDDYSLLVSLMGGIDVGGRILHGWILDLKVLPSGLNFLVFVSLAGAVLTAVPAVGANMAVLAALCTIYSVFASSLPALQAAVMVERLGGERLGAALSVMQCITGFTFLFSQPVAGYIFDTTGSWDIAFYYSGGAMIGGAVIMGLYTVWAQITAPRPQKSALLSCVTRRTAVGPS